MVILHTNAGPYLALFNHSQKIETNLLIQTWNLMLFIPHLDKTILNVYLYMFVFRVILDLMVLLAEMVPLV